ncbi:MAG: extracellular solute-binding protein [Pseudomonadales bacterium]
MNKILKIISASLFAVLLIGCGSEQQDPTETVLEAQVLAAYPISELTEELIWETNLDDPIFADPQAIKGGTLRMYNSAFPLTLRSVGPDSNNQMRTLVQGNQLGLIDMHPVTDKVIPVLATHWAYGNDGKTIYYKLNPQARWSDGKAIRADDYLFTLDFMRSPDILAPWYNNHYTTEILEVKKYDDLTISVTGSTAKPKADLHYYYSISPTPRHFHILNEDWVKNYNWKIEPNSGPYKITNIRKGKYLDLELKKDWWAKDLKYFKYRFNVDRIRVKVIRDEEIAFRHFMKGELDLFPIKAPKFWHERATGPLIDNGYIHKIQFYNNIARSPFGFYLNQDSKPLDEPGMREALASAINFDGMLENVLRGDYERLPSFNTGHGKYSNTELTAPKFDLDKANALLDAAGWDTRDSNGIRTKNGEALNFGITYGTAIHTDGLVYLKEEAKKAGIELRLDMLDAASFFKKLNEKTYQLAMLSFGVGYRPAYWQHFHSENAHKPQTNNMTNMDKPEIDELIMQYRAATAAQDRERLSRDISTLIHQQGAFIPGYYAPYTRSAYWRWLRLPSFVGTAQNSSPFDLFGNTGGLFWLDPKIKEETLAGKKAKQVFEKQILLDTQHKVQ